jgi:DNA-binding Lrp family transcriptional regulator
VTLRQAKTVAKDLGTFTRRDLADGIGVTPLQAGRYLTALEEAGLLTRDGRTFRWDPVEERPASPTTPHKNDDPRVLARKLKCFTVARYASVAGISTQAANERVKRIIADGMVRYTGDKEFREKGPAAMIFEVVELPKHTGPKRSHTHEESERIKRDAKLIQTPQRGTVEGTGKKKDLPGDPKMRELAERIIAAGGKIQRSGSDHFKATLPNGRIIGLSNTPDRSAWKKARAEAKRKGFNAHMKG